MFKAYLTGNQIALASADTAEVVRVRHGGFDHRQTAKVGTHLSLIVDPPGQVGLLAESIRLREAGFLIRGKYKHNLLPVFMFFCTH